jgi:hypothetical protein
LPHDVNSFVRPQLPHLPLPQLRMIEVIFALLGTYFLLQMRS